MKDSVFQGNISSEEGADLSVRGSTDGRIDVLLEDNLFDGRLTSSEAGCVVITGTTPVAATIIGNTFLDATAGMKGACLDISPYRDEFDPSVAPFEPILVQDSTFTNCVTENSGGAISIGSPTHAENPLPITIDSCTFINSHANDDGGTINISAHAPLDLTLSGINIEGSTANGHGGALYIGGYASVTLTLSDTSFAGTTANGHGGAIDLEGDAPISLVVRDSSFVTSSTGGNGGSINIGGDSPVTLALSDTSFGGSSAGGKGGAVNIDGDGPITLSITDTIFDQQISGGGGSAIASIDEALATIRCGRCTITGGQAGFEGGAVDIDDFVTFESIDSDWGSLSTNNSPNDLVIPDYLYRNLEEHETFSCSPGAGCTIDIP